MNKYTGVSGNWCWISFEEKTLRWALGHAWRLFIVAIMLVIYILIFFRVRRRLKRRHHTLDSNHSNQHYSFQLNNINEDDVDRSYRDLVIRRTHDDTLGGPVRSNSSDSALKSKPYLDHDHTQCSGRFAHNLDKVDLYRPSSTASTITRPPLIRSAFSHDEEEKSSRLARLALRPRLRILQSSKLDHETRHWAMMSAFPLTYVLVLMPQIINRVAELAGYQLKWLVVSQASTQLTGFVNAAVYGLREHRGVFKALKRRYYDQV